MAWFKLGELDEAEYSDFRLGRVSMIGGDGYVQFATVTMITYRDWWLFYTQDDHDVEVFACISDMGNPMIDDTRWYFRDTWEECPPEIAAFYRAYRIIHAVDEIGT